MSDTTRLFKPLKIGNMQLANRLAMAPLTRLRNSDGTSHVPLPIVTTHFAQRSIVPGTFLVTDATVPYPAAGGTCNTPGIWTPEQISAFSKVAAAVHANKSFIFQQLWDIGRAGDPAAYKLHGASLRGPSAIAAGEGHETPREMTEEEILESIEGHVVAAKNAIKAGMDGVELHGANGYLVEQFLQPAANQRSDRWGGNVENRARFAIEIIRKIAEAIGPERVGIRLSPWANLYGLGMEDPREQYLYLIKELKELGLAYLHLIESHAPGENIGDNKVFVEAWGGVSPVLLGGGLTVEQARVLVNEKYSDEDVVAVVGRWWTSNPDLLYRVKNNIPLAQYDRSTFYTAKEPRGYIDFPFSEEFEKEHGIQIEG